MGEEEIGGGVVHDVPDDLREALTSNPDLVGKWNSLTPLARNEWICWTTIVKQPETRKEHVERLCTELLEGKRRPCCWPGCPHRNPKRGGPEERRRRSRPRPGPERARRALTAGTAGTSGGKCARSSAAAASRRPGTGRRARKKDEINKNVSIDRNALPLVPCQYKDEGEIHERLL